jgi:hypothetical protein
MRLQVNGELGNYIDVEGFGNNGIAVSLGVQDEEYLEHNLDRKQVIELIAMLLVSTSPALSYEELDESLVKLVFNNLPPGEGIVGKLGILTEDDFMEDHGDNL